MAKSIIFQGKTYRLYRGEKYYSRGPTRLHVQVWRYYFGAVPEGMHVHHKNGDAEDNRIENLELVEGRKHLSEHAKERHANPIFAKKYQKHLENIQEKAKQWHGSDEGRAWHGEHARRVWSDAKLRPTKLQCIQCNKQFETVAFDTAKAKFCSNNCKSNARRKSGIDNETRNCIECNEQYSVNKYSKSRTCSRKCRGKLQSRTKVGL